MTHRLLTSSASTPPHLFSRARRFCLCVLILTAPGLTLGCRTTRPPSTQPHQQIREIVDAIVDLRASEPNLAGFKDHEVIASNAFGRRSREDAELLLGRLYYETLQRSQSYATSQVTPGNGPSRESSIREKIRGELSKPRPVAQFGREYFDNLISDTKARAAQDRAFLVAVNNSSNWAKFRWNPKWDTYTCIVDGIEMPNSYCRFLVVHDMAETLQVFPF